jgi:tRNA(Ile)-lysidine synthase
VAVSGGVDSMALLHYLAQANQTKPRWELIMAHLNHGIRPDAAEDQKLVEQVARQYDLPFETETLQLGQRASEATAREARYAFLERVKDEHQAIAIVTAHQQDDVLETAIINLSRGTGRKGLSSLGNRPGIVRPLLAVPKQAILEYAQQNGIRWREDSTNREDKYLRNYIRNNVIIRLADTDRQQLLNLIENQAITNEEIDTLLVKYLHEQGKGIERYWFNQLPHNLAKEYMASWLRHHGVRDFDRRLLERLAIYAKTGQPNTEIDVVKTMKLKITRDSLALDKLER